MKMPYTVTMGAGFDAGVIPAGPLAGNTEAKRELADDYQRALADLVFSPSVSEQEGRKPTNSSLSACA
jgi:hypothetical protein